MGGASSKAAEELKAEHASRRTQAESGWAASGASKDALARLVDDLKGQGGAIVATIGDADATAETSHYETFRNRLWNKDRLAYPWLIVRVLQNVDIARCIRFAVEHKLHLCIAGGCHSARAMADGDTLVIDMALMNKCVFDPATERVTVEGGSLIRDMEAALLPHNYCMPTGTQSDTGVAGLTLSGGMGWSTRMFGMSVDSLLEVEVVLADGTTVTATDDNAHSDLLWGCRGGGGNFGVVSKFTFKAYKLHNEGKNLQGEVVYFCTAGSRGALIAKWYDAIVAMPNETFANIVLLCGKPVVPTVWVNYGKDAAGGLEAVPHLKPAQSLGGTFKMVSKFAVRSYAEIQSDGVKHAPAGFWYESLLVLKRFDQAVVDVLVHFTTSDYPNGDSLIVLFPVVGKIHEVDASKASLEHRNAKVWGIVQGRWSSPDGKQAVVAWVKRLQAAVDAIAASAATTHIVSLAVDEVTKDELIFDANKEKLRDVKTKYDPTNVFHQNRNILPR